MKAALLLFDGIAALDVVGPYEVLANLPGVEVVTVSTSAGPKRSDRGSLALVADRTLAELPGPEIVVVPGGIGTRLLLDDEAVLGWLRAAHETSTWTTSVCTGALVLGAAGLLEGRRATTNWDALELLARFGATVVEERFVEDGRILTAAGVSAGIDMALHLAARVAGERAAQAVQLGIEYDPSPPFDTGSPAKAGPELTALVRRAIGDADEIALRRLSAAR